MKRKRFAEEQIIGVLKEAEAGAKTTDAPPGYGMHKTIYNRFIRWSRMGVFNRIFAALAAKGGKPDKAQGNGKGNGKGKD